MAESDKENSVVKSSNSASAESSSNVSKAATIPAPVYQLKKDGESEPTEDASDKDKKGLSASAGGGADGGGAGDDEELNKAKWQALFPSVNFNFNSSEPAKVGAKAFAKGNDLHFGPGNDDNKIIGHEAMHVVQQQKGLVEPTGSIGGVNVNTDSGLEAEADAVGEKAMQGGVSAVNAELGSLKSMPYKNSDSSTTQMWPDSWRDLTPDFIESGVDAIGDAAGELTEAAMEAALRLIDDAGTLLSYIASLSAGLAKKAMIFVAKNMQSLFISVIKASPGHELIYWGVKALMDVFDVQQLVAFLENFGEEVGKTVLRLVKSIRHASLKDIILFLPRYALSGFVLALMSADMILEVLMELAVDKLTKLLTMAKKYAMGIRKLLGVIAANIDSMYDKVRAALISLGVQFVQQLIEAYSIMLEIVKKIVEKIWPVGAGVQLDAGIGATFGIPIYAGVNYVCYIEHVSPGVFRLFRRGVVKVGVDTGVGVGASIGGGGKDGESSSFMLGAEAGANAGAGLQMAVMQEFDFPIYQDMAFISFLATATGTDTGAGFMMASKLLAPTGANLDPMVYNTKTQFKFGVYAEASAEASAGLRVGEQSTNGQTETWGNEAKPDTLGAQSGGPWYMPNKLLRMLNAGISGNISAQANAGVEMRQGNFIEDENGQRIPGEVEMDIFGEGSFAANIAASLPVPVPIPNLGIDTTIGLKATYKFKRNGSDDNIEATYKRYSAYVNGGDMDVIDGNATENEFSMEGDSDLGFQEFLEEAKMSFRRKQRFSLNGAFGRKFQSRANRQDFTRVMNRDGRNFGANVNGYLTYEFELSSGNAKRILARMATFHAERIANGEWQFLIDDLITLFTTGQMAPYLEDFLNDILAAINVKMLQSRWSASLGVAADGSAGAGAKVRLHGNLSAGVFRNYDLIAEGQTLTVQDIRELLINGASAAGLGGEEQAMVPATEAGRDTEVETVEENSGPVSEDEMTAPQPALSTRAGESEPINAAQENELEPEQEGQAQYTEEEKVELDSVKYELIAHGMAYTSNLDDQQKAALKGMGLTGWVQTVNSNEATGLFAGLIMPLSDGKMELGDQLTDADKAYLAERRAVLAFRGSEVDDSQGEGPQFVRDWLHNDMDAYAVGHTAFNLNYKEIEKLLVYAVKRTGKRVVVTGHSLGGSLAKQCALHFPQYVEQAYTYQAPGIAEEQQDTLEQNAGTGKDILGRELTPSQEEELRGWLRNENNLVHTIEDIDFVSHTSAGDIVHNAGGGRVPDAQRRHHHPAGIINGWTPAAHVLYLTSSEEFTEQHEVFNRILGNVVDEDASNSDKADVLFDNATHADNDIDPTRIKQNSTETDSTRHETMESLRRTLIANPFNPQARLLVENPGMIENIPVESKIILLNNLMRGAGLNLIKHGADLRNGHQAIVVLFANSSPSEQIKMVNASGGILAIYEKLDGMLSNVFTDRSSSLRTVFTSSLIPAIDINSCASTINSALSGGFLGMGDNTAEKLIADILVARRNSGGEQILEIIGGGDYDAGLKKVLRKLQWGEDNAVRSIYQFKKKRKWFWE